MGQGDIRLQVCSYLSLTYMALACVGCTWHSAQPCRSSRLCTSGICVAQWTRTNRNGGREHTASSIHASIIRHGTLHTVVCPHSSLHLANAEQDRARKIFGSSPFFMACGSTMPMSSAAGKQRQCLDTLRMTMLHGTILNKHGSVTDNSARTPYTIAPFLLYAVCV